MTRFLQIEQLQHNPRWQGGKRRRGRNRPAPARRLKRNPRKSEKQLRIDSALANLKTVHEMNEENRALGEGSFATWHRNRGDVERWVNILRYAGVQPPAYVPRQFLRNPKVQESYWTYKAPPTPTLAEAIAAGAIGPRTTDREWHQLSPGMRREIVQSAQRRTFKRNPSSSGVRIVYNRLLGGWYVVRGPHQTPLSGRFNSKAEAEASLTRVRGNPRGLPFKRAQAEVRAMGLTLTRKAETDEYRVNFAGGKESTAYYTNDLADAIGTARHMAAWSKADLQRSFKRNPARSSTRRRRSPPRRSAAPKRKASSSRRYVVALEHEKNGIRRTYYAAGNKAYATKARAKKYATTAAALAEAERLMGKLSRAWANARVVPA
jgi:hypothetical protein